MSRASTSPPATASASPTATSTTCPATPSASSPSGRRATPMAASPSTTTSAAPISRPTTPAPSRPSAATASPPATSSATTSSSDTVGMKHTPDGKLLSPFYTWGIYLDDYSSGTLVYGNIVARTFRGAYHNHLGFDNIVENNIFVEGHLQQAEWNGRDDMRRNTFVGNIVVYSQPRRRLHPLQRLESGRPQGVRPQPCLVDRRRPGQGRRARPGRHLAEVAGTRLRRELPPCRPPLRRSRQGRLSPEARLPRLGPWVPAHPRREDRHPGLRAVASLRTRSGTRAAGAKAAGSRRKKRRKPRSASGAVFRRDGRRSGAPTLPRPRGSPPDLRRSPAERCPDSTARPREGSAPAVSLPERVRSRAWRRR